MKHALTFTARSPRARGSLFMPILLSLLFFALPALSITLVSGGSTTYVIAKQTGCDADTSQAATDFQSYINQISGVTIPINSYNDMGSVPTNAVVIGNLVTSPTLAMEEVAMKVSGSRLILRGGSSLAHRYAVFTFLEEELGVRYYTPAVEKVPSQSTITVSDAYDKTHAPSFNLRYIYQGDVTAGGSATWRVKNRVNGVVADYGNHNMYEFVPPATYFSSHPEYYPLVGGNRAYNNATGWLCFTNQDLPQIIANGVKSRMSTRPVTTRIVVAQHDASGSCGCQDCQTAYAEEGNSWNGVMLRCLNAAADIVAQTYPNHKMLTFAYMHTEKAGTTAPRSNLVIRYHHWMRCDLHGITECTKQNTFRSRLNTWDTLTAPGQLDMWHYWTNFEANTMPWPNVRAIVPTLKYYAEHGVTGITLQGVYNGAGGDLSYLKCYLAAKALWDKDVDYTTVYEDFTDGYYGAAGEKMRAYIDLLEDRCRESSLNWHPDGISVTVGEVKSKLLPASVMAQADSIYDEAEAIALNVSQTLFNRVRYDRASLLYAHIYNKERLERIDDPADRLVKFGDNNYYERKKAFFEIIGQRIVGSEFSSWWRSNYNLRPSQAGNVYSVENDAIKVSVCPWVQGAIVSIVDKNTGKDLIHCAKTYYDTSTNRADSPFNGFFWHENFKYTTTAFYREAAMDADCVVDPQNKTITITYDFGTGSWSPSSPVRRSTKTITLHPTAASFTVSEKRKNLDSSAVSSERAVGRLFLGGDNFYGTIRATLPNDTTQNITSFPDTLNAKQVYFDNDEYGVRMTLAFDQSLPTHSLTVGRNDLYSFNTYTGMFDCGTFSLAQQEEKEMLKYTVTLSSIGASPSEGEDVIWTDHVRTVSDQQFGSLLLKASGGAAYNGDAVSEQRMTQDGWVQWQHVTQGMDQTVGLNPTNENSGLGIKYAIRAYASNKARVWEHNAYRGPVMTSANSDVWRIERAGSVIYYKKNGTTFYTSTTPSSEELMVDTCLFNTGYASGIRRARLSFRTVTGTPPSVTLTAPTDGAVYLSPGSLTLTATASDSDGTISKVEFYRNGDLLGVDSTSPYSYNWTATSGMSAITARAYDNDGNVATSAAANITVWETADIGNVGTAGSASYSNGAYTVTGAGAGITGTADAFRYVYMELAGDCTITARVTTWNNGSYAAGRCGLLLRDSLAAGARYFGATWRRDSTRNRHNRDFRSSTNGSVSEVYVDYGSSTPYWFKVVRKTDQDTGAVTATVYRATDNSGSPGTWSTYTSGPTSTLSGWSTTNYIGLAVTSGDTGSTRTAVFDNVSVKGENLPPSVSITSPEEEEVIQAGANLTITADAADEDGSIAKVEFYEGANKLGEDTSSPYSYQWTSVPAGSYVLTARATDNEGMYTISTEVNIKVNAAPTVSITSPEDEATVYTPDVTIEVDAADSDGEISYVEFYHGANKIGDSDEAPFSFVWLDVPNGEYTISAKAFDNDGGYTTSSSVTFTVAGQNAAPSVTLTAPTDGFIRVGNSYTLTATASDTDGTITKVEFYRGQTKLGEDTSSPYSYEWTGIECGQYSITARAYDDGGKDTVSDAAAFTVWNTQDIGSVGTTGSSSYNNDTGEFTVNGAGAGLVGTADAFRFTYLKVSGDCTIVAKVTFVSNNTNARGGPMIRESLDVGSKHMSLLYRRDNTRWYTHYRSTTDGSTSQPYVSAGSLPLWTKIVRSGNTFTTYYSSNGTSWTQHQSQSITMSSTVYIGLGMTSYSTATTRQLKCTDVSVTED